MLLFLFENQLCLTQGDYIIVIQVDTIIDRHLSTIDIHRIGSVFHCHLEQVPLVTRYHIEFNRTTANIFISQLQV